MLCKPRAAFSLATGAVLQLCREGGVVVLIATGRAAHSADRSMHDCWIGIDYSNGIEYEVFFAAARPHRDGYWRRVYCKAPGGMSHIVAVGRGQQNWLQNCHVVEAVALPEPE